MKYQRYTVKEGIFSQTIGSETVLLDMNGEEYFGLNPTGTVIWNLLSEKRTLGDIHLQLEKLFDAPSTTLYSDMMDLIKDLQDAGLIYQSDNSND